MFWRLYYYTATLLNPLAQLGLRSVSGLTSAKRARVLILRGDQVLLVQDIFSQDNWSVPGGGINRGEDPARAASREIKEELGLDVDSNQIELIGRLERDVASGQTYEALIYVYRVNESANTEVRRNKWEIVRWDWHTMENLPGNRASVVDKSISLLKAD